VLVLDRKQFLATRSRATRPPSSAPVAQTPVSAKNTKRAKPREGMRAHYDFSSAKRGRFPDLAGGHVVVLDDAVWRHFGSEASVLEALRSVVASSKHVKASARKSSPAKLA
jgi:hypothetical protein